MIKSTNLSFGNAPTVYRSMATDQMDLKIPEGENRGAQLEKNRLLKVKPVTLAERVDNERGRWPPRGGRCIKSC